MRPKVMNTNSTDRDVVPIGRSWEASLISSTSNMGVAGSSREPLLILSSAPFGGIVDYLHYQANAIAAKGVPVTMLGVVGAEKRADADYEYLPFWRQPKQSRFRRIRQIMFAINLIGNMWRLAAYLETRAERHLLFGSYVEYLAPVWARWFRRLTSQGWHFGTIIHDPVRNFILGPQWWHQKSIAEGYSFTSVGYVHGPTDSVTDCGETDLVSVPFGPYPFPPARSSGAKVREELGIPDDAQVILSFGHIRDGKNLDLLQQAVVAFPSVHLVVAGTEQSSGQKPASYYRSLADTLGIADRCHFVVRYIDEAEVGDFFEASDFTALTYSSAFRSASAALAACVNYKCPCIASSGSGPLKDVIGEYQLGIWVEPDSADAIRDGIARLIDGSLNPDWDRYTDDNSWARNADLVINSLCKAS